MPPETLLICHHCDSCFIVIEAIWELHKWIFLLRYCVWKQWIGGRSQTWNSGENINQYGSIQYSVDKNISWQISNYLHFHVCLKMAYLLITHWLKSKHRQISRAGGAICRNAVFLWHHSSYWCCVKLSLLYYCPLWLIILLWATKNGSIYSQ